MNIPCCHTVYALADIFLSNYIGYLPHPSCPCVDCGYSVTDVLPDFPVTRYVHGVPSNFQNPWGVQHPQPKHDSLSDRNRKFCFRRGYEEQNLPSLRGRFSGEHVPFFPTLFPGVCLLQAISHLLKQILSCCGMVQVSELELSISE